MKRSLAVVSAGALALSAGAVALAAAPAGAVGETVSITVEMDLPFFCVDGPLTFQVTDAPIGAGPELTGDAGEITLNPCGWRGSVSVDVDPTTKQITVATANSNTFQTAVVTVTYPGIGSISTVSDTLWEPNELGCTMAPAVTAATGTGATISWGLAADCATNGDPGLADGGAAVFAWGDAAPTTTTTTTAAPTTTAPAAVAGATVTPAFTG